MTSEFGVAVHALVFLSHRQTTHSSEELAQNICTNPARVRKIMSKLKKAGLIETKEGAEGGYSFVLAPEKVSLCEVAKAVGVRFVGVSWRSGDIHKKCMIASGMADIMDGIYNDLNRICLERIDNISILDIRRQIFAGKEEKENTPAPEWI